MKCTEAEHLIAERVLGFVSVEREKELEEHLAVCSHCRQEVERYFIVEDALRAGGSEQIQPDFADRVVSLAGSANNRKSFRLLKLSAPSLAAAAVLLAIVISPVFFSNDSNDMTRLEVLEAYAEDMEVLGIGENATVSDAEFGYENYGVSDKVSEYLVQ